MTSILTKVNNLNVTFSEGEFRNVKVYVDGELQEEKQSTWFLSALLQEAIKLKEENKLIEEVYDERVEDIKWLMEDVERAMSIFQDIQTAQTWNEWDELKIQQRISEYIKGQEIVN